MVDKIFLQNKYNEFINNEEKLTDKNDFDIIFNRIRNKFSHELVTSNKKLGLYYILLCIIGYFISLSICAQNSIGITDFSYNLLNTMNLNLTPSLCAILCGSIFTGIPAIFSILFLNRFKRRYLFFKMFWIVLLVPIVTTVIMGLFSFYPMFGDMQIAILTHIMFWTLPSILFPYFLYAFTYLIIRQRREKNQCKEISVL